MSQGKADFLSVKKFDITAFNLFWENRNRRTFIRFEFGFCLPASRFAKTN